MKKVIYGVMAFALLTFSSCGGGENTADSEMSTENTETAQNEEEEEVEVVSYILKNAESHLEWTGSYVGGDNDGKTHNGIVEFSKGTLTKDGDNYTGGVAVDMTTINVQDLDEASGKPKLEGHLSTEDFFNVGKYAVATAEILEVIEDEAKVKFTVAGVDLVRTVPLTFEEDEDKLTITGDFVVDFTKANFPGMQVNPEKPEQGSVSPEVQFNVVAVFGIK